MNKKELVQSDKLAIQMSSFDPCCYNGGNGEVQTFTYTRNKKWVDFGSDNRADLYIESLLDMNEDHSAILKKLNSMVIGQGFVVPTDPQALAMYMNKVPVGQGDFQSRLIDNNYSTILNGVSWDLLLYGAFAIHVRWWPGNIKIADIHHVDVRKVRIDSNGQGYWLSNDWSQYRKERYTPVHYNEFSDDPAMGQSQIMYVKLPNYMHKDYGLPYYWAGRSAIQGQQTLMSWYNNQLMNGFNVDIQIHYPDGFPEAEIMDRDQRTFAAHYQGANAIKALVTEGGLEIKPFEKARLPDDLKEMQRVMDAKVRVAHSVVGKGELFGLRGEGSGMDFSTDSLNQEWEAYDALQVKPMQKVITDAFDLFSRANSIEHKWQISPYVLFPETESVENPAVPQQALPTDPNITPTTNV